MSYFYSIAMATISNTLSVTTSKDSQNNSETDLNDNTEDKIQTDTSNWTLAEKEEITTYDCFSYRIPANIW